MRRAGPGQAVAFLVAGGRLNRRGAVPRCEVSGGAEPADVTEVPQQPGGAEWADPVELAERTAPRGHQMPRLLVRGPNLRVDDGQLLDELTGQLVAGMGHDAHRLWGAR